MEVLALATAVIYLIVLEQSQCALCPHTSVKGTHFQAQKYLGVDDTVCDLSVISPDSNKAQRGHEGHQDHTAEKWTSSDFNARLSHSKCHLLSTITSRSRNCHKTTHFEKNE